MTTINPMLKIKNGQKQLAAKIREHHDDWDSVTFRHQHIAYCELRGRTRDQIEKPGEDNEPNEDWITKLKNEWGQEITEWRAANGKE